MDLNSLFAQNEFAFYGLRALILVLALLVFAVAMLRWRRSGSHDMQQLLLQLDESRGETRQLADLAQRMAAQLQSLQERFDDRQQLAIAGAGPVQRGYDLALQMARHGATPDEMISASGVTRHEASLLAQLHNPSRK